MEYKKKRSTLDNILIIFIIILLLLIAFASAVLVLRSRLHRGDGVEVVDEKLSLGNRYLSEMEYEKL